MFLRITSGLADVGKLIPTTENPYKHINQDQDTYLSLYQYNSEQKIQIEEVVEKEKDGKKWTAPRGVSGITDVYTRLLAFDFDSPDLEKAKQDTVTLVERLKESGIQDGIKISFSGNKGFSVIVNHDKMLNPEEHKHIAKCLAGDLETFDTKIYNASRIFRMDYTRHQNGLYKTPLSLGQIKTLSADKIRNLAKKKIQPPPIRNTITSLPKKLLEMTPPKVETKLNVDINAEIDFSNKPSFLSRAKYVLTQGHIPPGMGNEAYMILAATYRGLKFDKNDALNLLISVNEKRVALYGESAGRSESQIKSEVIETVYSPTWKGGTYSEKANDLLATLNEKYNDRDEQAQERLVSLGQISNIFNDFATNIDKNTIKLGIDSIDRNVRVTTSMLVCLLAAPSAGKTAVTMSILNTLSNSGIQGLFFSLDMGAPLIYQRLVQRHTGKHADQVFELYKDNRKSQIESIERQIQKEYEQIRFSFKSGLQIEDIRNMIKDERKNGRDPKFIAIDYLECLQGPHSDQYANQGFIAQSLKDIANEYGVCVFLLVQPQKHVGDPSQEINSYRAIKGSSAVEQAASIILTIHRPGFDPKHPEDDQFLNMTVVKNRMGHLGTYDFAWEGLTGVISEMTTEQKDHLKAVRQANAEAKAAEKKEEW